MTLLLALLTIPAVTSLACWLITNRRATEMVNVAGAVLLLMTAVATAVYAGTQASPLSAFGGALRADALSVYLILIVATLAAATAIYSVGYMRIEWEKREFSTRRLRGYYALLHAFVGTMILVAISDNLGIMWVALEATTLTSGVLVAFSRTKEALEAAWKYLILCTVGIALALFGIVLTYFAASQVLTDNISALNWTTLMAIAHELDPAIMKLAFVFILVGYGTKAGIAPLHSWLPDAHSQAPAPVSALLSGVLLGCALYAIFRFHLIVSGAIGPAFSSNLLIGAGIFSLSFAAVLIFVQKEYKRLLAYSSVEHIGLIAIGVGIGGKLALFGAALHLVTHAISKALLFFASGRIAQRYGETDIQAVRGALLRMPITGTVLFIGALAIAGSPPFGPFVSELAIIAGAFQAGDYALAVFILLTIVVIFAGVLSALGQMAFGEHRAPAAERARFSAGRPNMWMKPVLVLGAAGTLIVGPILPSSFASMITEVARILAGGT